MESQPPLEATCTKFAGQFALDDDTLKLSNNNNNNNNNNKGFENSHDDYCELPLIDLSRLYDNDYRIQCEREVAEAAKEWGFFQIVKHGISTDVLVTIQNEQRKLFQQPFHKKADHHNICYRWGNPMATSLHEFSWSEAFHIPLPNLPSFSMSCLEEFTEQAGRVAQSISEVLAENLGSKSSLFAESCLKTSSYVRLNRYPPCPTFHKAYGLIPHTDSDFLTILYQDQIGGLQLLKDGNWINIKPNQHALIVNIGDLFEAWSNGVYKSVKHRVVTNPEAERLSIAYFLCPSYETVIQSYCEPSLYRKFSFGEYRNQVQQDVKSTGTKIGLPKFLNL